MGIKCCFGCRPPKRHTACWDTCPDYIKEKAEDQEKKEAERKRRRIDGEIIAQRSESVQRAMKKRKT